MPDLAKRLTNTTAARLPLPVLGYVIHWCPETPGFGVRVSATGDRAYVAQRRVDGKTVRRTLGKAAGAAAISADSARRLQLDISSELQNGEDRLEAKREQRRLDKADAESFADALREYTKSKRRTKDGKPLKDRTKADYLAMIEPASTTKAGRPTQAGELQGIANRPLHRITADEIRALHVGLAERGERRQTYALQVLRAVLRHYGVTIENNPLSPTTAGAARVALAPSRGKPSPIPAARLGAWWRAACDDDSVSADQLRFQLLTGCRPGEVAGVTVADVDFAEGRLLLSDTKNRLDHVVMLSKQARSIAEKHAKKKRPTQPLFGVIYTSKALGRISAAAEVVGVSPHKLRHTFASVAAQLVPAHTLRKLLNHTGGGDTASIHYVGVSDEQLRAAWQAVADFIAGPLPGRRKG